LKKNINILSWEMAKLRVYVSVRVCVSVRVLVGGWCSGSLVKRGKRYDDDDDNSALVAVSAYNLTVTVPSDTTRPPLIERTSISLSVCLSVCLYVCQPAGGAVCG